jgi:hypothetical protein
MVCFEEPADARADPIQHMAFAMASATHADISGLRRDLTDHFRKARDRAPPDVIGPRSWAYWNSRMGRYPPPPRGRLRACRAH